MDAVEWKAELALIEEWFAKIGDRTPEALQEQLTTLKSRFGI